MYSFSPVIYFLPIPFLDCEPNESRVLIFFRCIIFWAHPYYLLAVSGQLISVMD